ncbi:hypothetical protein PENNAL_c0099G06023 [Penicillium nalgiovense]|uniref:Amidase domain-containing protein n=1 Tax=Penicillium nalgiovense TaxID=60175 RepID=A0A1V6XAL1_PENNA|nr:hypothetical protein PENNAL_c0099G06023 [Penicillium nalgiovense]
MVLQAILALSARHDAILANDSDWEASAYHGQCLQLLIAALDQAETSCDENMLIAVVILRIYEELETNTDQQFHLLGSNRLVNLMARSASAGGVAEAVSWQFLRQAIYASVVQYQPLQLDMHNYERSSMFHRHDDGACANRIIYHCARILQVCCDAPGNIVEEETWRQISDSVNEWNQTKSTTWQPIRYQASSVAAGRPFPEVWMISPPAVIGMQYYHSACIFLTLSETPSHNMSDYERARSRRVKEKTIADHLVMVIGLSLSNESVENAYFMACHLLHRFGYCLRNVVEHEGSLKFLARVENMLGWRTSWIMRELEHQWAELAEKQLEDAAKIPTEWRIPEGLTDLSETSGTSVLDVPRQSEILSARQPEITEKYDATDLLGKIHRQELSAHEVTNHFAFALPLHNKWYTRCLTETFFERALQRAKDLDEKLSKTGTPVGPLHGLPINLKDCFNIKGIPSTIGFASFIKNRPVSYTSPAVRVLLNLGAIPYVKTNVPQTMMAADSHNYVFGRTLNPHRSNLSAGGSTGGEGALISMRGSVLGVGTDNVGSIRIPAISGIKACAGPLATSQDTNFPLHPPVLRTLTSATEKLQAAGIEIIPLHIPPLIRDACTLAFRMFSMDPARTPFKHIAASGEPVIPALASTSLHHRYMPYGYAPLTLEGLYDLNEERNLIKEALRNLIARAEVDAIIMPSYQGTAQPYDVFGFVPYTVLWNLVDYPSCIIPHDKANKAADQAFIRSVDYKPPYVADHIEGAPCSVQLVGRNMHDEELMKVVEP